MNTQNQMGLHVREMVPKDVNEVEVSTVEKEIAKTLVENKDVLISRAEIQDIVKVVMGKEYVDSEVDRVVDEVVGKLPLYEVYSGFYSEDTLFLFLPETITRGRSVEDVINVVSTILEATYGDEDVSYDVLKTIIARVLYNKFAGGLEYGNALAWYHARLIRGYGYDEVVDQFDYKYYYVGSIYYRVGEVWVRARWYYCNRSRYGYDVGIQKCVSYDYETPEGEGV